MEEFYSYEALLNRLRYSVAEKNRRIVFLLGSPISAPHNGSPGVANVDGIVDGIKNYFKNDVMSLRDLERTLTNSSTNAYQAGVNFLLGHRGQDAVNDLIRKAVIGARLDSIEIISKIKPTTNMDDLACDLEDERGKWFIPDCVKALATLIKKYPKNFDLQLTTNFDPLLSIEIQNQGGYCFRSVLSKDGSLNQTQGEGCHIVHLHGYWRGSVDTLHTPRQLTQSRPKLKASLSELLKNNIVIPIAYSGWDDIFTQTLVELARDDSNKLEVLWTYFSENDNDLISQNKRQIDSFDSGISSGRLLMYKGVDCHKIFPDLLESLTDSISIDTPESSKTSLGENELINAPSLKLQQEPTSTDTIPQISELFGRDDEIKTISDWVNVKLISINGLGGQGKSSLAALYALNSQKERRNIFIDWRDCREYDNTFLSVLIRAVHHVSAMVNDQVSISNLREAPIEGICAKFVEILKNNMGVVVFDNVDQYVDLETGEPLHELRVLIDSLVKSKIKSQVIFTSRPYLDIQSEYSASFVLRGLEQDASKQLFEKKYGNVISMADLSELYFLTEGHPLWISLIASRCRHENKKISEIVNHISSGKGDLPERTILSTWSGLNDKQKTVLRMLAELERPLTEDEFAQIDFELNYSQITKALKILKSLSLVEVRQGVLGGAVIDLHPLIRQYIRKNFPRTERQKFISRIILVIDRKISAIGQISKGLIPISLIDLRLHKTGLNINNGDFLSAIETLYDLYFPLIDNGLAEEFIRQSVKIFDQIDWLIFCAQNKKFNYFWSKVVKSMVELDKLNLADKYIASYEMSINGKGAQYINLCDVKCYRYWFCDDFEQAIYYGQQGLAIQEQTGVDTDYSCTHNLALAWRDNMEYEKALNYFLGQAEDVDVLNPGVFDIHKNGNFYGNIGRCYYFMGLLDNALICYKKSAILLEKDEDEITNRGYIRHWIGELLYKKGQPEDGFMFVKAALEIWNNLSPRRSESLTQLLNEIIENYPQVQRVMEIPKWRLENRFKQWIST